MRTHVWIPCVQGCTTPLSLRFRPRSTQLCIQRRLELGEASLLPAVTFVHFHRPSTECRLHDLLLLISCYFQYCCFPVGCSHCLCSDRFQLNCDHQPTAHEMRSHWTTCPCRLLPVRGFLLEDFQAQDSDERRQRGGILGWTERVGNHPWSFLSWEACRGCSDAREVVFESKIS